MFCFCTYANLQTTKHTRCTCTVPGTLKIAAMYLPLRQALGGTRLPSAWFEVMMLLGNIT